MATQWPLVVSRLVEHLPTLDGWDAVEVWRGAAWDVSKAIYATVGHASDGVTTAAGNYTTTQSPDGYRRLETGSVVGTLVITRGDTDLAPDTASVFTLMDQVDAWVRADRRLGVLSAEGTSDLVVDVGSSQDFPGSNLSLMWTLNYTTVT